MDGGSNTLSVQVFDKDYASKDDFMGRYVDLICHDVHILKNHGVHRSFFFLAPASAWILGSLAWTVLVYCMEKYFRTE